MKWAHLPNEGGLYNQSPKFLDDLEMIFAIKSHHEQAELKKQQSEMGKNARRMKR